MANGNWASKKSPQAAFSHQSYHTERVSFPGSGCVCLTVKRGYSQIPQCRRSEATQTTLKLGVVPEFGGVRLRVKLTTNRRCAADHRG